MTRYTPLLAFEARLLGRCLGRLQPSLRPSDKRSGGLRLRQPRAVDPESAIRVRNRSFWDFHVMFVAFQIDAMVERLGAEYGLDTDDLGSSSSVSLQPNRVGC